MPLESVTYISDLVATNPVNATDQVAQGDDHIRNIKAALLATFPNVTGAVTPTHTQLNTAATLIATDQGADKVYGWDESANAAIAYTLSTGLTTSTTNLQIDTTVVPRLDSNNTFSGDTNGQRVQGVRNVSTGTSAYVEIIVGYDLSSHYLALTARGQNLTGALVGGGATDSYALRTVGSHALEFATNNTSALLIDTSQNFNFRDGTVTTDNTSASEVGFKGLPTATDETPVLADAGKIILATTNVTIPANGSVALPVGTVIPVYNTTAGSINITVTTDTLVLAGVGTITTGTLAAKGLGSLTKVASTTWVFAGAGAGGS